MGAEIELINFPTKMDFDWLRKARDPNEYDIKGLFIHPASNLAVMAGQGTIGLEILEDLPDVNAILTPYGGGGLSCGVASAVRSLNPCVKLYACEPETSAPLAAAARASATARW